MHKVLTLGGALVLAGTVALVSLQAQTAPHQDHDPDKMTSGAGIPAGWLARLDSGSTRAEGVRFMLMGTGVHFMTGPAGIYWKPEMTRSGPYQVSATFNQMEPAAHPEAYGLFVGGVDLNGAGQKYTYFLIRQDGKYLIKRRAGANTPTIADWTDSPAVKKTEGATQGSNTLTIAVTADKVRFAINGTEVSAVAPTQVDTAGIVTASSASCGTHALRGSFE